MSKWVIDAVAAVEQARVHVGVAPRRDHLASSAICWDYGRGTRDGTVDELGHKRGRIRFASDVASISSWSAPGPIR